MSTMTMPPKGCVLFDIDGVLVDSKGMYIRAVTEALKAAGTSASAEEVARTLTPDVGRWVHALKSRLGEEVTAGVVARARNLVAEEGWKTVRPCASPLALLEFLRSGGYATAVVSNAPHAYLRHVIDRLDLAPWIGPVFSCSDRKIDKGAGLELAVQESGASRTESMYIGDTAVDVVHARRARVGAVILYTEFSWDYPDLGRIEKERPDLIVSTLDEVKQWLQNRS